jgi:phosphotransferase system enzyme I (PtsI)
MRGIGVSPGISIGPAFIIRKTLKAVSGIVIDSEAMKDIEINKFDLAVITSAEEIEDLKKNREYELHKTLADILDTQIEFLTDPQIRTDVIEKILKENKTACDAVIEVIDTAAAIFESIEDEYLSARASDIKDI